MTNTIIGNGIPKMSPPPIKLKESERLEIGRPLLKIKAKPRPTVIIPNVTMNGAILLLVIMRPLINPKTKPAKSPPKMGTITGKSGFEANKAATTPATATIDPTDKSIPPVIITNVTPNAKRAFIETCVMIIVQFETVKN